jgi:hypothetical protein
MSRILITALGLLWSATAAAQPAIVQQSDDLFILKDYTTNGWHYDITPVDSRGVPLPGVYQPKDAGHRSMFSFGPARPRGTPLSLRVAHVGGSESWIVRIQPYDPVLPSYDIFHFFHEEGTQAVWAIGSPKRAPSTVVILRSASRYFEDENDTIDVGVMATLDGSGLNAGVQRSLYVDRKQNVIVGWRPAPLIAKYTPSSDPTRNGTLAALLPSSMKWQSPDTAILMPMWNVTEEDHVDGSSTLFVSEYGDQREQHHRVLRSDDPDRKTWGTWREFSGSYAHIHGYHVNPVLPNVHHLFRGDPSVEQFSNDSGYFISTDSGRTWSGDLLADFATAENSWQTQWYNGPCFVTWWPSGRALITSDTAATGHAWWWGSGPYDWRGRSFERIAELNSLDPESHWPDTPWMAVAVAGAYETYAATSGSGQDATNNDAKTLLWRYDANVPRATLVAEMGRDDYPGVPPSGQLKWLSSSRHNQLPADAKYFFTSHNRRFPRDVGVCAQPANGTATYVNGQCRTVCATGYFLDDQGRCVHHPASGGWISTDVNHDGQPDFVHVWDESGRLGMAVYALDSTGWHSPWGSTGLGAGSRAIGWMAADVNGDGSGDIVQGWPNGSLLGLTAFTSNGFRMTPTWGTAASGGGAGGSFLTGDVDGDGREDIIQWWDNAGSLAMALFKSDGAGYRLAWSGTTPYPIGTVVKGDVDGDGRMDVMHVWGNDGATGMTVYRFNGTAMYVSWSTTFWNAGPGAWAWLPVDMDGDGRTDFVQVWETERGTTGMTAYHSNGVGFDQSWGGVWDNAWPGGIGWRVADINGDGKSDLVQLWDNAGYLGVTIYQSTGAGYVQNWSNTNMGGGSSAVAWSTGDVNGDKRADLVQVWDNGGTVSFINWLSDGRGLCTSLATTSNCGTCGTRCNAPNTVGAACTNGGCTYAGCAPGWLNCNGNWSDGCERAGTSCTCLPSGQRTTSASLCCSNAVVYRILPPYGLFCR